MVLGVTPSECPDLAGMVTSAGSVVTEELKNPDVFLVVVSGDCGVPAGCRAGVSPEERTSVQDTTVVARERPVLVPTVELVPPERLVAVSPVVREDAGPLCVLAVSKRSGVDGEILVSPKAEAATCGDVAVDDSRSAGAEEVGPCAALVVSTMLAATSEVGGTFSDSGVTSEETHTLTGMLLRCGDGLDSGSGLGLKTSVVFMRTGVGWAEVARGEEGLLTGSMEGAGEGEGGVTAGEDSRAETEAASSTEAMPALDTCSGPMLRRPVSSGWLVSMDVVPACHAVVIFSPGSVLGVVASGCPK
nr:uncharacterized protein LOC127488544 [Oryctolagus cuniculus]